jgi:hypothetical protein
MSPNGNYMGVSMMLVVVVFFEKLFYLVRSDKAADLSFIIQVNGLKSLLNTAAIGQSTSIKTLI